MDSLIFFYFASVIVFTAALVVAARNPIYSALSLLVMFFHVAGLYITLHAEFLAAIQIIVYAGAILVLYLFVVMLLNLKRDEHYHRQGKIGVLLGLTLLAETILLALSRGVVDFQVATPAKSAAGTVVGNTESIGEVLYSTYLFPFEIASLILLVAMIGAIILTKKGIMEIKGS